MTKLHGKQSNKITWGVNETIQNWAIKWDCYQVLPLGIPDLSLNMVDMGTPWPYLYHIERDHKFIRRIWFGGSLHLLTSRPIQPQRSAASFSMIGDDWSPSRGAGANLSQHQCLAGWVGKHSFVHWGCGYKKLYCKCWLYCCSSSVISG